MAQTLADPQTVKNNHKPVTDNDESDAQAVDSSDEQKRSSTCDVDSMQNAQTSNGVCSKSIPGQRSWDCVVGVDETSDGDPSNSKSRKGSKRKAQGIDLLEGDSNWHRKR